MATCKTCEKRKTCTKICGDVEKLLPSARAGTNKMREVLAHNEFMILIEERGGTRNKEWAESVDARRNMIDRIHNLDITSRQRDIIRLYLWEGMTQRETAHELKINISTVKRDMQGIANTIRLNEPF